MIARFLSLMLLVTSAGVFGLHRASAQSPKTHHVAFQVDSGDPTAMNLALMNVSNMEEYYRAKSEPVTIEVVVFGPGLTMLRDDISPVKTRLDQIRASFPSIVFSACENTRAAFARAEGHEIPLWSGARSVPSGVVRLSELQEQGWTYLRP